MSYRLGLSYLTTSISSGGQTWEKGWADFSSSCATSTSQRMVSASGWTGTQYNFVLQKCDFSKQKAVMVWNLVIWWNLKLCDISVLMPVEVWCLLLTTVNCREQSLCSQVINSVLARRFGWADSLALCWISLIKKELVGLMFHISQNIQYSCLDLFFLEHMLLCQQHPPFFSTPEQELFWDCHFISYFSRVNKDKKVGLLPIPYTHPTTPVQQEESCFPPTLHKTLWHPQFPRQNCQWVPGYFSLFLYKLFLSAAHTAMSSHARTRGSLGYTWEDFEEHWLRQQG